MVLALIGFGVLFALLFLGVPIAFGMGIVGFVGFAYIVGTDPALAMIGETAVNSVMSYNLSILPLFILMGNLVSHSRLSDDLYEAAHAFIGHWRGGLAMATIVACGGFSAVSGSSLATAATMSRVAIPSMQKRGYAASLATGSVAAGGTLGILIPPSIILVIYGIMTEENIGKLFAAGIIPGLLGITGYIVAIAVVTRMVPTVAPKSDRVDWRARWRAVRPVWMIVLLFAIVMGGIYFGVFTPTEAAGIGAGGAFIFAVLRRLLGPRALFDVLVATGKTSAIMFAVLIGALIFANFVNVAGLPQALAAGIANAGLSPLAVMILIMCVYLILGCVFDTVGMVLLTVPIFYPIVAAMGYDLVWFGILVVVATEIGLITPPIGMNVYMVKTMAPGISAGTIFRGVTPFIGADVIRLALILLIPQLSLWLPSLMKR